MKIFKKLLEEQELKRGNTFLCGNYKGFNIAINIAQSVSPLVIKVSIKSELENYKDKVNEYLNNLDKKNLGISYAQVKECFCEIHIDSAFEGKMIKQANEFLTNFVDFLNRENFESGCQVCGNNDIKNYEINETYCILCNGCANKIQNECEEARVEKAKQKSNFVPGVIGAILGSLLGVIAWILIYNLRIYSKFSRVNYSSLCSKRL